MNKGFLMNKFIFIFSFIKSLTLKYDKKTKIIFVYDNNDITLLRSNFSAAAVTRFKTQKIHFFFFFTEMRNSDDIGL